MILVIALLVLGPEKLPEAARQAGRVLAELRRMSSGFQAEMRDAMHNPVAGPPAPSSGAAAPASTNGSAEPTFLWSDLPSSPESGGSPPASP